MFYVNGIVVDRVRDPAELKALPDHVYAVGSCEWSSSVRAPGVHLRISERDVLRAEAEVGSDTALRAGA